MKKNRRTPIILGRILTAITISLLILNIQIGQNKAVARTSLQSPALDSYDYTVGFPIILRHCMSCYYIDSVNGSDTNSGIRITQPWKTLSKLRSVDFVPGTIINLKRGSIWNEKIKITDSGAFDRPITIAAYGIGPAPILSNPGDTDNDESIIGIFGDNIVINGLHLQDSGIGVNIFSNHNIVKNSEMNNVGYGVVLMGQYNLITNNSIHDTRMVLTTPGGKDDYGADGVDIQNSHNEISYNHFVNCEAPSYDYGVSGGAIEIYNNGDYTSYHHNWSFNTGDFVEISGGDPGTAQNVSIFYNVIINATRFTVIHGIQIQNFRVENNTIIDLRPHNPEPYRFLVFMGTPATETSYLLRNNIIYLNNNYDRVTDTKITHENNLYYGVPPGFIINNGEIIAAPQFVNLANFDLHLMSTSPAINAGMDLGYYEDFDLSPVPIGNLPDIGAFEYQGH